MPTFIRALAATLLTFSLTTTPTVFAADPTAEAEWLELFNGKDLNDWIGKSHRPAAGTRQISDLSCF